MREPVMIRIRIAAQKQRRRTLGIKAEDAQKSLFTSFTGESMSDKHPLLSLMLPPAVKEFFQELEKELLELCGGRYSRLGSCSRWGSQYGSITLGNQKVRLKIPRVRDRITGVEVPLKTYQRFQDTSLMESAILEAGLRGTTQRKFIKSIPKLQSSFGVDKSSVSRHWKNATLKKLEELQERRLEGMQIKAVLIDGKRFSSKGCVIALGVSKLGTKHVLGVYQYSTENSTACLNLLKDLHQRGLPAQGILFIVDGGSGLNKAINEAYFVEDETRRLAYRVRCYYHKWNNLRDCLDLHVQAEAKPLFWGMRDAPDLTAAKACSDALEACLKKNNLSALRSYHEGKADLLALHQLSLSPMLKKFFSTTNAIESLNSLLEEDLRRVKNWRDSEHFMRWVATSCLENEKKMRRIRGHNGLPALDVILNKLDRTELLDKMG
jgi:transposase-like protein